MKRIIILMAFAALLAGCHRSQNTGQGGAGETGTYQGTTGSQGTTSTNNMSGQGTESSTNAQPETTPPEGGTGTGTEKGPGSQNTDTNTPPDNTGDQAPQ